MKKIIVGLMVAALTISSVGVAEAGSRHHNNNNAAPLAAILGLLGGLWIGSQLKEPKAHRRHQHQHRHQVQRPRHRPPYPIPHRQRCVTNYTQEWNPHYGWVPVPRTNCNYR
jgi:hypothetical protein